MWCTIERSSWFPGKSLVLRQFGFSKFHMGVIFGFVCLMLNVPVNNFSVMLGRSHHFLCITSFFFFFLGGGGKYVLLKDTTQRRDWD